MLDIGVARNGAELEVFGPIPGKRAGLGTGDLEVHVRSEALADGSIRLQIWVYECEGESDKRRLLSESNITTSIGTTTEFQLGSVRGQYTVQLTPNLG